MQGSVRRTATGLLAAAALAMAPAAAHAAQQPSAVWRAAAKPAATRTADITAARLRAFTLDAAGMKAKLATAPTAGLRARAMATGTGATISLPAPDGTFQRFAVQESPVMDPALAAKHPNIKTYVGRGLDDPDATIRADQTPLGFHASVRSPDGNWYIDPYYHLSDSVYASYYGRDLKDAHGAFREGEIEGDSDPLNLGLSKAAADSTVTLRTYRLALVTDQSYATFFGGPANVTAAKVTLMNRVDQIYEDETAIRMILIADNDKLNLDTDALASQPNGPCGGAACFTTQQLSTCGGGTLTRNQVVVGQIIGARNYDVGHIMLGKNGGGVAQLGVVGGNNKARGCTGLPTPVGDFMAVDYVSHEMGHEFAGNHTFNGTQLNCSGGNRNAGTSVEPGSGTSIMAYAGICQQDNLQPHSDPYWSQRSYDEITAYTSGDRAAINEVQTASLTGFDGTDSFLLGYQGRTANIVRGTNYSAADIQGSLQGNEVQGVKLTGYDADGDAYALSYHGATTVPIVHGQNNTAAGIQNAVQGGNEQQQAILTGFSAATQTFQIQVNGTTTATFGQGGLSVSNNNVATAINAILGATGTATSSGAGNGGITVTFGGGLAGTDVPSIAIVNCSGTCAASVRETAKGGTALAGWPAGATVAVGPVTDAGYTLSFGGALGAADVDPFTVANPNDAVAGAVSENEKGGTGSLPAGATAAVAASGLSGAFDDNGFQVTFGGTLAGVDVDMLTIQPTGATGFISDTHQGGPINNKGFLTTDTGNHAPVVTTAAGFTIPIRTPFSLTGSATDADSDPLTYMWEQNDIGVISGGTTTGTALVNNTKTNGPLFRQFGTAAQVSAADTLKTPSPGENAVDNNPTRVFPDMAQVLADNTNAATGTCPTAPPAPAVVPLPLVDCYSEFLPTPDWQGTLSDRTLTFRLTARDYRPGGGGIGSAQTRLTIAPLAGPFRVTSQAVSQVIFLGPPTNRQTVTWDVAGTDSAPVNVAQVKISLSTDGGKTFPYVLAAATPNDGSETVTLPDQPGTARIKVEAIGNVFFDVSHADLTLVPAPTTTVSGTVPAQLSLALGGAATFAPFQAGAAQDYNAGTTAPVVSTAGDAALAVTDPSTNHPGHLVNGAFAMPSALQAKANAGTLTAVSGTPATLLTYSAPVSNDQVALGFRQHIGDTDAMRTGTYSKTLTFTLSTTQP
jgi:hypothetical protein